MSERREFTPDDVARLFDVPVWMVDPSLPIPRWFRVKAFIHRCWHGFYWSSQ